MCVHRQVNRDVIYGNTGCVFIDIGKQGCHLWQYRMCVHRQVNRDVIYGNTGCVFIDIGKQGCHL